MPKPRRYDLSPDNFIAGIAGQMTATELGLYWLICLLVYSNAGPIEYDEKRFAALLPGTHWRTIKAASKRLQETGKITRSGSQVMAKGCSEPIQDALTRISKATQNGLKGGRPHNDFNNITKPDGFQNEKLARDALSPSPSPSSPPSQSKEESSLRSDSPAAQAPLPQTDQSNGQGLLDSSNLPGFPDSPLPPSKRVIPDRSELDAAYDAYNAAAQETGWPECQRRTKPRDASMRARLREVGGISGWRSAMDRARASPFLRGERGRDKAHENWTPDIDFFLKQSSFTKLMEGNYDDRNSKAEPTGFNAVLAGARAALDRTETDFS